MAGAIIAVRAGTECDGGKICGDPDGRMAPVEREAPRMAESGGHRLIVNSDARGREENAGAVRVRERPRIIDFELASDREKARRIIER